MRKNVLGYILSFIVFAVVFRSFLLPITAEAVAPTNGLTGYWKLDETSGLVLSDSSGNNYGGTLKNSPAWILGKINNALNFNGTNQYTQIASNSNVNLSGTPYTVSFWFNHTLTPSQSAGIISKYGSNGFIFGISNGKFLVRHITPGGSYTLNGNTSLPTNSWQHATVVYDRNTIKVYINGVLDKQMNATVDLIGNTEWLEFGRFSSAYYKGILDEVRLYSRAISVEEVTDIYNDLGVPPVPPEPDTLPPTTPQSFSATPVSSSGINLAWNASTDNTAVVGYTVFRNGTEIATTPTVAYSDAGLTPSTNYNYFVRAYDAAQNISSNSDTALATTNPPSDTTPPVISAVSNTSPTTTATTINWTTNETSDSQVEYGPTISYGQTTVLNSSPVTSHTVGLSGLTSNTLYHYRVLSRDGAGNLAVSQDHTFTTLAVPNNPPGTEGLLGHWKLDESSGITASDSSVSGYFGTLQNNPVWQTGILNNGLGLNGSNQHVTVPNTAALKLDGTTYTYSTWFRTSSPLKWQGLISKEGSGSSYIATINSGKILIRHATPNGNYDLTSNISISANTWYHLVVVYDRTALRIYINGNPNTVLNTTQDLSSSNNGSLYFGRFFGSNYLVGMMDEVRIYNKALTAGEVQDLYNITLNPPPPPVPDTTVPIISAINVSGVSVSGATINWVTNENSDSQVEFGTTTNYGSSTTINSALVTSHAFNLQGLSAGTTYHYRVKSRDLAGNTAVSLDQVFTTATVVGDSESPSSINDFAVLKSEVNGITLNWVAPSDVPFGNVSSYDIRYSTSQATLESWDGATQVTGEPTPVSAGLNQKYIVSGLTQGTNYYFTIRSRDAVGNLSAMSNVVSSSTLSSASNVKIPLIDLLAGSNYFGFEGGLYENISNVVPSDHNSAGLTKAASIQPLDINGNPSASGKVIMMSMGMSNTSWEFCSFSGAEPCTSESFMAQAAGNNQVNKTNLLILNGALGGQTAPLWDNPLDNNYDRVRDTVLNPIGVSEKQVQVIWIKIANSDPDLVLPSPSADMYVLENTLGNIIRSAKIRYPNLKQVFLSSRVYAGYANGTLNPEPYAYEYGFTMKRLIDAQIQQMRNSGIVVDGLAGDLNYTNDAAPWISWGPYMWADGLNPRSDGLVADPADFAPDGVHPTFTGSQKIATQLMQFFLSSPYTTWFRQ